MKIITYATDYTHSNIKLLQNKLSIELIPNYIPWTHTFYAKVYGVYRYIENFPEDEVVLFCDGYDVLPINLCNIQLLETNIGSYFNMEKVTFNAEINCYPDSSLANQYPFTNSKWKFLNSGIYVGTTKNIKKMCELSLEKIRHSDDQLQLSLLFLNMPSLIDLDYTCKVFQTLYNNTIGGKINEDDFIFDINNRMIINKYFNTKPLLFHGNGKINMSILTPYL